MATIYASRAALLSFKAQKLPRDAQPRCRRQQKQHMGFIVRATNDSENQETGGPPSPAALLSKNPSAAPEATASTLLQGVLDVPAPPEDLVDTSTPRITPELSAIYATCKDWTWSGYRIVYSVQGSGPPLLLVHGFGASLGHWRRNIGVLAQSNRVYAIDLLGLGASEKPPNFKYTMEIWADMLLDFIKDVICAPTILIGNSIGSLACTIVAAEAPQSLVQGMVLLNCSGGMNNKAVVDDWRIRLFLPLLWLIDFLLLQKSIATRLFQRVQSRENLRNILQGVYCSKEAVDDELIEVIAKPAQDPGALDAFVSVITGPPGPSPIGLFSKISVPVLVLWGDKDPFTPIDGPVGKFFRGLPATQPNVQLRILQDVGHCPQDDRPDLVHKELLPWLANVCGSS